MRCLCLTAYPPSSPLTLYVVCCVAHMLLQNCVYARGGGGICVLRRTIVPPIVLVKKGSMGGVLRMVK